MSELYSYPTNDYRSYLAHHGVKGMKWGVRHEQARKARIMRKYGITSKQYESIRNKTRERRRSQYGKTAKEYRRNTIAYGLANSALSTAVGATALKGSTTADKVGYFSGAALGTAGALGINYLLTTPKQYEKMVEGRSIMDNIIESTQFRKASKK